MAVPVKVSDKLLALAKQEAEADIPASPDLPVVTEAEMSASAEAGA